MAENSKIEWTDHTFNPWVGCAKVSPACKFCYAETFTNRYRKSEGLWSGNRARTSEANWKKPLQWNRKAEREGKRHKVFCASLADVFEDHPDLKQWRSDLFDLIEATPNLDWLLLTKRPENIMKMERMGWSYPQNIWFGATAENITTSLTRVSDLATVKKKTGNIVFLSCEPLLGEIDMTDLRFMDWVIIGGESGFLKSVRHLDLMAVQKVVEECAKHSIPVFMKQVGTSLANSAKLKDKKGGNMDEWPRRWDWLKQRKFPTYE